MTEASIENDYETTSSKDCDPPDDASSTTSKQSQSSQGEGERATSSPVDQAVSVPSRSCSSTSNFAQARSPPPVVDTHNPSNRCSSPDHDSEDATASPTIGTSPFALDFLSVDTSSSVFSKRKSTPKLQLRTVSQEIAESKQDRLSKFDILASDATNEVDSVRNGLTGYLTPPQESKQEDAIQVEATPAQRAFQEETSLQDVAAKQSEEESTNASLFGPSQNAMDVPKEAVATTSILDDLEEDIDQQLATIGQLTVEQSPASQLIPRTSWPPSLPPFDEPMSPQTSWGIKTCEALSKPEPLAISFGRTPAHPLSIEFTRSSPPEERVQDLSENAADEDGTSKLSHDIPLNVTCNNHQNDNGGTFVDHEDLLGMKGSQDADSDGSISSPASETSEGTLQPMIEPQSLLDLAGEAEKQFLHSIDSEFMPARSTFFAADKSPQSTHDQDRSIEDGMWIRRPTGSTTIAMSSHETPDEPSIVSNPATVILSSPSNISDTDLGMRVGTVLDDSDVFEEDESDMRLAQFRTLLSQELHSFEANLLQQVNCALDESTSKWNTARNSIVATLIARPFINEALHLLESSVRVQISEKQAEILSRLDASDTKSLENIAHSAKVTKKHLRELQASLKKAFTQHIDRALDERKGNKAPSKLLDVGEESRKTVVMKIPAADKSTGTELTTTQNISISTLTKKMESLIVNATNQISEKLDRSRDRAKTEQNENIAVVGVMQRDIIGNLQEVLVQSTLQNQAINYLTTKAHPLIDLIKGISHDTTFIDAKLAKNAAVLTTVTEQAEKLEKTANSFDKVVKDARVATSMENAETVGKLLSEVAKITAKVEALQDQMVWMQQQMSRVLELLTTRGIPETAVLTSQDPRSPRTAMARRDSESGYTSATPSISTEISADPSELLIFATRTTFDFEYQNGKKLKFRHPAHLSLSDLESVTSLVSRTRSIWTKCLARQGVFNAQIELISIWLPATVHAAVSTARRLVDNDTAYNGWFKAATSGHITEDRPLLNTELLVLEKDSVVSLERPRSKKRKQEEMRKGSDSNLEFRLGVWDAARQSKY